MRKRNLRHSWDFLKTIILWWLLKTLNGFSNVSYCKSSKWWANELTNIWKGYGMICMTCKSWYDDTNQMNVPMNMKCFPKDNLWLGNVINRLKESQFTENCKPSWPNAWNLYFVDTGMVCSLAGRPYDFPL